MAGKSCAGKIVSLMALLSAIFLTASGCAMAGMGSGYMQERVNLRLDRFGVEYMTGQIRSRLQQPQSSVQPVIVTTFVDLNQLDKSSVFGRVISEQVLDRFQKYGITVVEIRKTKDVFLRDGVGEVALSRDVADLAGHTEAKSILVGTYVVTESSVIINARLVDIKYPVVLSSSSYELPLSDEIKKLITGESPL